MLRAKAIKFQKRATPSCAIACSAAPTRSGKLAEYSDCGADRQRLEQDQRCFARRSTKVLGVHPDAILPNITARTFRKRYDDAVADGKGTPTASTRGRVALYATCYGRAYNRAAGRRGPGGGVPPQRYPRDHRRKAEQCCGVTKLELGDLEAVARAKGGEHPGVGQGLVDGAGTLWRRCRRARSCSSRSCRWCSRTTRPCRR